MTRVFVFLSGNGTATARETSKFKTKQAWQGELDNLAMKGFHPYTNFSTRTPWLPKYQYFLRWAVHNLGI